MRPVGADLLTRTRVNCTEIAVYVTCNEVGGQRVKKRTEKLTELEAYTVAQK